MLNFKKEFLFYLYFYNWNRGHFLALQKCVDSERFWSGWASWMDTALHPPCPNLISGAGTSSLSGEYKSPCRLFLSGDCTHSDLNSPRSLSDQARQELDLVNQYLSSRQLTRVNGQLPVRLFCFRTLGTPTALMGQLSPNLEMIQWFFLSHPTQHTITTYITVLCQLIIKGHDRVIQLFDPAVRDVPLTQVYLQQLSSQSLEFQCAVADL